MIPLARNKSLLGRLLAANLLLLTGLAGLLTTGFLWLQLRASEQQIRLRAEALADFVASQSEFALLVGDAGELERIARNAAEVEDVLSVALADAGGGSLARVARLGAEAGCSPGETSQVLCVERAVLAPREGAVVEWKRQSPSGGLLGKVRIAFSLEQQRALLRQTVQYGIAVVAVSLVLVLACLHLQLHRLLEPLKGLMDFTRQVGAGDLTRKAPVGRLDEVGQLGAAFNQMVERLGSTTVSRNYVNNILHSMAESLIVTGPEGVIETVNPATQAMLGYREEELAGQRIGVVLGDTPNLDSAEGQAMERIYRLKEGRSIPVLFSSAPMRDPSGGLTGFVLLAQDITERRRAEEELREAKAAAERANRAKTEFLSRTSHELRTPLNAILGFSQLLEIGDLVPEDRESVDQILKAGRHLVRLVDEVLDISGLENGRRTLSPEPVPLGDAMREAVDLIRPLAAGRKVELHLGDADCGGDRYVYADAQRLRQVFLNLLSNAVKFNREGGQVRVWCEPRPGDWLRIAITDTGPGISSENLGKLFVPFERLGAEQSGIEGTGLGLVHSKSLIQAMRGNIGVESTVGQGSTFWVELPQVEAPLKRAEREGMPAPAERKVGSSGAQTVLYIEDIISNRQLVERILALRPEVRMLTAADGNTGLAMVRRERPDVVLLDLHLPGMPGDQVLRELRADPATAALPVVVLSADATPGRGNRVLALGAQAFLTKPVDIRLLVQILDEYLAPEVIAHA